MAYEDAEIALAEFLRTVPGLDSRAEQVSLGDFKVLSLGYDSCAVLTFGGMEQADMAAGGVKLQMWRINCDLYLKYVDDAALRVNTNTLRQNIVNLINKKPTFGHVAGIIEATLRSISVSTGVRSGTVFVGIVLGGRHYYHEVLQFEVGVVAEEAFDE